MNSELDAALLNRLPMDVILNHILPYTYLPQKPRLLMDIRSYRSDYDVVENLYFTEFNVNVLMHDLIRFCNNNIAPMYGVENRYERILKRHYYFNDKPRTRLITFVFADFHKYRKRKTQSKINFLWGLLRPIERTRFINLHLPEN